MRRSTIDFASHVRHALVAICLTVFVAMPCSSTVAQQIGGGGGGQQGGGVGGQQGGGGVGGIGGGDGGGGVTYINVSMPSVVSPGADDGVRVVQALERANAVHGTTVPRRAMGS